MDEVQGQRMQKVLKRDAKTFTYGVLSLLDSHEAGALLHSEVGGSPHLFLPVHLLHFNQAERNHLVDHLAEKSSSQLCAPPSVVFLYTPKFSIDGSFVR